MKLFKSAVVFKKVQGFGINQEKDIYTVARGLQEAQVTLEENLKDVEVKSTETISDQVLLEGAVVTEK